MMSILGLPYENKHVLSRSTSGIKEFFSLTQKSAIRTFIEDVPKVLIGSICLKMDVLNMLSMRSVK